MPAFQETTVGCERMAVNHLRSVKVHGMACFQCMLSKGRGGYLSFLQNPPVFCQAVFQASSGLTNIPPRAALTWHTVHNTFLLIRGYHVFGVHQHVFEGAQWTKHRLDVQGCEDSSDSLRYYMYIFYFIFSHSPHLLSHHHLSPSCI